MPYIESGSGHKIYYERHGDSGPVVILIHGLASSTKIWSRQVRVLKKNCQLYTFDFPGHGKSNWQMHYALPELAELPRLIMDACGLPKANIAAISLGCWVAMDFAAKYPDRIEKLILEGPIGACYTCWNPLGWKDLFNYLMLPVILYVSMRLFGARATAHWINTYGVKAKRNFKVLESVQNLTDFRAIRELLWQSACIPINRDIKKIQAPTLLIRGQNDPMPQDFVRYLQQNLPNVTYVEVPGTRHLVALEKPGEFNRMALEFLSAQPTGQRLKSVKPAKHRG